MTIASSTRPLARTLRRALAVSAVCFAVVGADSVRAAVNAGPLEVRGTEGNNPAPITSGSGGTEFALAPPSLAACTGDSATAGYRVHSYMVPASVDPATILYESGGPSPAGVGADFKNPLFDAAGSPWVSQNTAPDTGVVIGLPSFSFGVFSSEGGAAAAQAAVPPGVYNVGIACILGLPSPTQVDKFWNVQFEIAHDAADATGLTWTVVGGSTPPPTTVAGGPTTTVAGGPTTTVAGGPTTTVAGGPTTTVAGRPTTTIGGPSNAPGATTLPGAPTTLPGSVVGGGGGTTGGSTTGGSTTGGSTTGTAPRSLPRTGSTWVPFAFWAIVLLALGRIAVLASRNVVVKRPPHA
jgi:hypothetical protein